MGDGPDHESPRMQVLIIAVIVFSIVSLALTVMGYIQW